MWCDNMTSVMCSKSTWLCDRHACSKGFCHLIPEDQEGLGHISSRTESFHLREVRFTLGSPKTPPDRQTDRQTDRQADRQAALARLPVSRSCAGAVSEGHFNLRLASPEGITSAVQEPTARTPHGHRRSNQNGPFCLVLDHSTERSRVITQTQHWAVVECVRA